MTVNRTTLLDLPLPVTGTESGTWGDTTNNGLTQYVDIAVAGMTSLTSANFTAGALTLANTTGDSSATNIAAGSAQYGAIKVSSLATNSTITAPSSNRRYTIINADATYSVTIKASGQTGVVIAAGEKALVAFNGTDYVKIATANGTGEFTTVDTTNLEVTNIKAKDGTAAMSIADSTGIVTVSTQLQVDNLNVSGNTISSTDTNGNIVLAPNGTGDVQVDADTLRVGDSNANATLTTNGTGDLILNTNSGTNSGSITIADGAGGDITATPNGNGSVVITNSGTSNALRITQTGSGNALLVEDSANPDASPFVVDASGRVVIGHTSAPNAQLFEIYTGSAFAAIAQQYGNDTNPLVLSLSKTRGTTPNAPVIVANNDTLGRIQFLGNDGVTNIRAAQIEVSVDGTPGTNDMPGRLVFSTTADGASSPTERVRINSAGLTTVGYSAASGAALTTAVAAKLYSSNTTYTDSATAASGTVTHGTINSFDNPAIAASNASVTYTNASTVYIDGAPTAGSNVTITNPYALYVAAGATYLGGNLTLSGGTANGVLYLNGSKAATSGSALTFDGTNLSVGGSNSQQRLNVVVPVFTTNASGGMRIGDSGNNYYVDQLVTTDGSANPFWDVKFATHTLSRYAYGGGNNFWAWYANNSEAMRLTSTGLGIGTSSPTGKFTAQGSVGSFYVDAGATGVAFTYNGGNYISALGGANAFLVFETGGAVERMRLDSSGNLGLGVTPSAWSGTGGNIDQPNGKNLSSQGTNIGIGTNSYFNVSWKYVGTGLAARYVQDAGQHQWFTAASGTAGNAITFTQAMTLDASANLGVGVTSPSFTAGSGIHVYRTSGAAVRVQDASTDFDVLAFSGNATLTNRSNGAMIFATNNTERARITATGETQAVSAGDFGLAYGITAAAGTTKATFVGRHSATAGNTGTGTDSFIVWSNGNVINTNGSYGTISDAKMKIDIVDASSQWADIKSIRFRKFKMKDDPTGLVQLGVVAQELEQTSPSLVDEHPDRDGEGNDLGTTTKSVKTSVLLMKAAVALQEAMTRIETLEAKVAQLEGTQP
jgi:hypothetical protein